MWGAGCYWQPAMQPAEQLDQVAAAWTRHLASFGAAFTEAQELAGVQLGQLGDRTEMKRVFILLGKLESELNIHKYFSAI